MEGVCGKTPPPGCTVKCLQDGQKPFMTMLQLAGTCISKKRSRGASFARTCKEYAQHEVLEGLLLGPGSSAELHHPQALRAGGLPPGGKGELEGCSWGGRGGGLLGPGGARGSGPGGAGGSGDL